MNSALVALALLLPALILVSWHLDRHARDEQVGDLRADQRAERERWQDERRELLNRIKPETAQYATPRETSPVMQVHHDSDSDYWRAAHSMDAGISKDDLADALDDTTQRALSGPLFAPPIAVGDE